MNRPQPDEYAEFYKKYIDTVKDDVISELKMQECEFPDFIRSIPADRADHSYNEGKWTVKEVLGHVLDTERIMAYRLLRIARNDATPLPGFEENDYVINAAFAQKDLISFAIEFQAIRKSNIYLIESLKNEQLARRGTASALPISARALLFILAGHVNHHRKIIEERYL